MIYLISQVTFIFVTQIYYNMSFVTSSSNFVSNFPGPLRSIFINCFWKTIFWRAEKIRVTEYVCKTCLKELGILLKFRGTFEKLLAACNSSQNAGIPQFYFKVF